MHVGFTGTRKGWTEQQKERLETWPFWNSTLVELHHGDAIGADAEAHNFIKNLRSILPDFYRLIVHPPIKTLYRAWCSEWDEIKPVKEYLVRDKDIVNESEFLIATPKEMEEVLRSGTWSTVRYARKRNKIIYFFFPDGSLIQEYNIEGRSTKHVI